MKKNPNRELVEPFLAKAGIKINGSDPWDIQVYNEDFFTKVLSKGSVGLGESYVDRWWDCAQVDEFVYKILKANLRKEFSFNWPVFKNLLLSKLFNLQNVSRSKESVKKHYDLSNDLYMSFLDPYNQYSCGYFKDTNDLNQAQEKKLKLICEKLQLKGSDKVLDIGCGWGGLAKFAAENYGCHVTGITISHEQAQFAKNFTNGLPVEIKEQDYRNTSGTFDKIVSVGMIEHVGPKNYKNIFQVVNKCLTSDGLFLLHTIGDKNPNPIPDPWIEKYIFPNGVLPSLSQIVGASEKLFVLEDLQNFGAYYDLTLMAWFRNFDANWDRLKNKFDDKFYRMWKFYLLSCAGIFRVRHTQLWQFVYSKNGVKAGYNSVR